MKNTLYKEIKKYVNEHHGFNSELMKTELWQKIVKMRESLRQFEGKKVKIVYHYSADFYGGEGVKMGRIVFDGDKIKFYEGLNRSRFYWLDLGLFEGFYATLILKEIIEVSKEEFKQYLKEQKNKKKREKYMYI